MSHVLSHSEDPAVSLLGLHKISITWLVLQRGLAAIKLQAFQQHCLYLSVVLQTIPGQFFRRRASHSSFASFFTTLSVHWKISEMSYSLAFEPSLPKGSNKVGTETS